MNSKAVLCVFLSSLIAYASGCNVQATSYTTEDDLVIASIGFMTEFKLKCKSEINSIPLFAEVNGNIYPVFRAKDDYSFSWTEDKTAKTGNREVRLFDEEQFANYRKAQRAGENPSSVKELAKIYVKYSGSYGSNILFLNSESLVLLMSLFVAYLAFQNRMKLVS